MAREKKQRSRSGRTELPADYLQPLVAALGDPATLAAIRPAELATVAFQLALYFGVRRDPETASVLGGVYDRLVGELSSEARLVFVERVVEAVRGGASSVLALLPVLQREQDAVVARAAAIAFAMLMPDDGTPLAGPRALRALLDHAEPDGVRAGLVGALLALGDRRVRPLLAGTWRALSPAAAAALLSLVRERASLLEVEWLLDWMEDAEPATFAAIAHSLARLASEAQGRVLDLERSLPLPPDGESIAILRDWSVAELGARLVPRLQDLERRAGEAPAAAGRGALREVFAAWGNAG